LICLSVPKKWIQNAGENPLTVEQTEKKSTKNQKRIALPID
jgi:hypothetical protein